MELAVSLRKEFAMEIAVDDQTEKRRVEKKSLNLKSRAHQKFCLTSDSILKTHKLAQKTHQERRSNTAL